ncbi:traX family protein [Escherichia coli 2-210-07_S4_C1]|nr:traX family protein [Escherichia coli 2-210-07_S4_C1]
MASINTIVKRKQYLWLGIVVVGAASAIGGALYLSDVDMSGNGEAVAEQEPVPDMTGVVDTTFDDKVRQHATTEMQVTAAQMQKQYEEIRRELDVLNKQRGDDQRRIEKLGQDNAALAEQVKALGANPVTATGEPVPQMPASPPGPEGEPLPGNPPVSFPPQGSVAVPPPTAFYPGNGVTPPPQVTYQSVPVPIRIGDLPIIRDSEIQNFCLHGTVGAGKSEVIRRLANYARQRGDMVVIYDRSGEFVKSYYDPSIDKILNPLDARCAAWDLWKECLTQPDFDNTANTLIPMGTKEDPFWQGSGRTIFAEAAYLMRNDPNRSYSKLVDTLLSIKIEKLRTFLRNSPAANLVEEKIEKTAISIRAVLTNYVKAIRYLQGIEHNGESFTIRDWMAGLVMTVLTVGLVSCAGKSLPRFWPGDFFPVFYACHLAVLGILAL